MESVEARVLLSSFDVRSAKAATSAEVFRAKKSPVQLTAVSGYGVKGGQAFLTATLTSGGIPLEGKTIHFQVKGRTAGTAVTDGEGVAMRYLGNMRNVNVGVFAQGVGAGFGGDSAHKSVIVHGKLTVSRFPGTISGVSASGVFDGFGTAAATLSSRGTPLSGMTIQFQVMGRVVGTAVTNSQGVATLGGVSLVGLNAGSYANGVTASFAGGLTYTQGSAPGNVVVSPDRLSVIGITADNKVYDGTTQATVNVADAMLVGAQPGDSVTLNTSGAMGEFASKTVGTGKLVTVNGLTISGADVSNYFLSPPTTTANITAASLTVTGITAENKPYDGTTTAVLSTGNAALVGVVSGDAVGLNKSLAVGTFDSPAIGNNKSVAISGLTLTGADAGNYDLVQPTTTANITAGMLTVTGITVSNKVYDTSTVATLNTSAAALAGVAPGDTVTLNVSGATGAFATADAGNGINVNVSGLSISGADASKYVLVEPTLTANITPAPLVVTGITAASRMYNGSTAATLNTSGATLEGVFSSDTVTLNTSTAQGTFATKDVGTGIAVTVSGLSLGGADAGNYSIIEPTLTASITPAPADVNGVVAVSRAYNGTTAAMLDFSGATVVGVVQGDNVTLATSGATGTFASHNVGTNINVAVSGLSLAGADAGNYTLTQPATMADILPADLKVTGITAASKIYDGSTHATLNTSSATLMGVVQGDTVTLDTSGAMGTFASANVGTAINVTVSGLSIGGASAGNYTLVEPTPTADITPVMLQVTGIIAISRTYDGMTSAPLDTTGATLEGVLDDDSVTLNTSAAAGTFASQNVGININVTVSGLTLAGADAGNYSLTEPTLTADILPATLMVTGITAESRPYDSTTAATLVTGGALLVGVVGSDAVSLVTSGATGTFASQNVGTAINVAVSGLSLTGAGAGNYSLREPTLTADITPAILQVTGITADDRVYNGMTAATLHTSGAMLLGVFNGDTVTLDTSAAMGTFASKDVGTGITVTISGLSLAGAQAGNYMLVEPTTTTANITPAMLTVSGITADDKTFDGTTAATLNTGGAMLEGLVNGDNLVILNVAGAVGTFASAGPGTDITVNVTGLLISGTDSEDYTLVQPMTTATITD